ncbi:MAG TPA: TolC family protein, partial [Bacteroidia bacterium]|nr:TolC family protein [Bacteroidia bacterium]
MKKEHPLALRAENNVVYANAQLKAARGNYDPFLNSSIESKQFNSFNYFTYGEAELKQPIYTSQYLKMGYEYGQGIKLNPQNSTPAGGLPYAGVEVSLLQGLSFDKRRGEIIKSRYYTDFYEAERKIQLNDFLFMASNTYIDAVYASKINTIHNYFADLADQRLSGVNKLAAIGEKPAIDTIEASISLQGRLLEKQASELEKAKRLNEILALYAANKSLKSTFVISDSLEQLYLSSVNAARSLVLNESGINPIIVQYTAKQKILETESRLKREMIKPVLNVSYNFLSDTKSSVIALSPNNYKWSATFYFPLLLRKPINEYKMARLIAQNNEFEILNKQSQLNYKQRYIINAIGVIASQISNAEKAAAYSKILVEAEKLKFINGESSLFLLNARENKWLETELKLAEYKLKFMKTTL